MFTKLDKFWGVLIFMEMFSSLLVGLRNLPVNINVNFVDTQLFNLTTKSSYNSYKSNYNKYRLNNNESADKKPNPNTAAHWSGKQTAKYIQSSFKPTATWTLAL